MHTKVSVFRFSQWLGLVLFATSVPMLSGFLWYSFSRSMFALSIVMGGILEALVISFDLYGCIQQTPNRLFGWMIVSFVGRMGMFAYGFWQMLLGGYSPQGLLLGAFMAYITYTYCRMLYIVQQ